MSQAAEQEFDKEYTEGEDKFSFLGMTISLPAPGERRASQPVDPVEQRMTALRSLLKEKLGDTKFLAVYNVMAAIVIVAPLSPCLAWRLQSSPTCPKLRALGRRTSIKGGSAQSRRCATSRGCAVTSGGV